MYVPEGWSHKDLEQIAIIERGRFSPRPRNDPRYYGGYMPFVQTGDVTSARTYLTEYTQTLNDDGIKVSKVFPKNSILITIAANIGETSITSFDVACPDSVVGIIPKEDKANVLWLKMMLEIKKSKLNGMATQNAQKNINLQVLKPLVLLTPPLAEQQKIAQILSTWDKAIEKLEALIAAKQRRKKALMQQLLIGKKRFSGFDGKWKGIRLKKVIREEKFRNKDSAITRVLSVTNRNGFVLPEEQFSRQVASDDLSNYKIVRRGQFGYNPSRINVGSFARLDSYGEGVLSPMYVIFSINEKVLDSDFFLNWMSSHEAKQRILSSTQGSVRDSVGFEALSSFLINLPPIDEQQKIASVFSAADKEIEAHQKQMAALKDQKKGLMQQLLTGKKRVKIDKPIQLVEMAEA